MYTLLVDFGHTEDVYTNEGKAHYKDTSPSILWDEVVFEVPKKPLPKFEVDTKLLVWNKESSSVKYKRYFSHFDEKGCLNVFSYGATSFSADCSFSTTNAWTEYEVIQ